MDEILQQEAGHPGRGPVHGSLHQNPQILCTLRHQNLHHISPLPPQHLLPLLLRCADPRAHDHHRLDLLPISLRHLVHHKSTVADPARRVSLHPQSPQALSDASGLELDGAFGTRRGGAAEVYEVGHEEVEGGGEGLDLVLPLPAGVASEAVDEDEGGLTEASAGGDVEMDGGLTVVEIYDAGGEAAVEEVKG